MLRNFKNDKTFLSAKFQFSIVQFVKAISNKPFFPLKAVNPGVKLLEGKASTVARGRDQWRQADILFNSPHGKKELTIQRSKLSARKSVCSSDTNFGKKKKNSLTYAPVGVDHSSPFSG